MWVCRQDWHMCLANSVAMELANITQDTPEPQGGTIQKDIHGGTFLETDFWLHIDILSSKRVHIFCVHYPTASVRLNIVIRQARYTFVIILSSFSAGKDIYICSHRHCNVLSKAISAFSCPCSWMMVNVYSLQFQQGCLWTQQ